MHGNIKALLILAQVHTDEVDWVGLGQVLFRFAFKFVMQFGHEVSYMFVRSESNYVISVSENK